VPVRGIFPNRGRGILDLARADREMKDERATLATQKRKARILRAFLPELFRRLKGKLALLFLAAARRFLGRFF
jgi:hypothetical protein